jgi:glycosyltransferase involved in cell wall biosynthesis/SAM-dependent methyltransferase
MVARRSTSRVVMLLENNPYPQDVRVRLEAESLARAGYDVVVIAPSAPRQPAHELVEGVEVRRFSNVEARGVLGFLLEYVIAAVRLQVAALRELLRGAKVLHLHNPPDVLFPAGALFRLAGRKVIFDHHDLFPETVDTKFGSRLLSRLAMGCERATFRVANHVLATNQSYADLALTRGHKTADEVTIVRNGPPEQWLHLPTENRSGQLKCVQLGYLGAISSQDGVEGLAHVLELLAARGIDARLLVVGEGDGRTALEHEIHRRGLGEKLTITGWVAWDQVPEILAEADIYVDPAPATEVNNRSTMVKIAEYLALARPVVAFDLLETRRTADGAAVLVTPGDQEAFAAAIDRLANDGAERERLAPLGRLRAVELSWANSERALLGAYHAVTGEGTPRPRVRISSRPIDEDHEAYYQDQLRSTAEFWRRFGQTLDVRGRRILDIGCGHGAMSIDLAKRGAEVVSVDPNEERIEWARRNLAENHPGLDVTFLPVESTELPSTERFDIVVSKDTFEHVADLRGLLGDLRSRLRPGGAIWVGFSPLYYSPWGDHRRAGLRLPWAHAILPRWAVHRAARRKTGRPVSDLADIGLNGLTPAGFRRLVSASGLSIESIEYNRGDKPLLRAMSKARQLPILERYMTVSIYAVLKRGGH